MKSQIIVWLLASIVLSTVLPNVVVVAIFTPIAVSMLKAAGYEDIKTAEAAVPILCCIGWGARIFFWREYFSTGYVFYWIYFSFGSDASIEYVFSIDYTLYSRFCIKV